MKGMSIFNRRGTTKPSYKLGEGKTKENLESDFNDKTKQKEYEDWYKWQQQVIREESRDL